MIDLDEVYLGENVANNVTRVYKGVNLIFERGGGLDPDVQTLLDQAAIDGYTPCSGTVLTALDLLVITWKSIGFWGAMKWISIPATNGDSDFALYNIKNPTQSSIDVNSVAFTPLQGFQTNGINNYLDSGYDVSGLSQSDASLIFYSRILAPAANSALLGVTNGFGNRFEFNNRTTGAYRTALFSGSPITQTATPIPGWFNGSKSGTTQTLYNNTNFEDSDNVTNQPVTGNVYLGGWNNLGSLAFPSSAQYSLYAFGEDAGAINTSAYNAFQTYMTTLGTQV